MRYSNDNDELRKMKAELSIVDLALTAGWTIDRKESSRNHVVLRHNSEKINVIPGRQQGVREVFSTRDSRQASGTVIDFACYVSNTKNIGEARAYLRPFLSSPPPRTETAEAFVKEKAPADFGEIWSGFKQYEGGYLEGRGLTPETIAAFGDRIKIDTSGYGNVVFAHCRGGNVTGWEAKNFKFRGGFAKNGTRTLFTGPLDAGEEIEKIVILESAIDAMSYFQLDNRENQCRTLYASLAGNPSKDQINQIIEIGLRGNSKEIIVATDADEAGDKMAMLLTSSFPSGIAMRLRPRFSEDETRDWKKDWNDLVLLGRTILDYERR